MESAAATLPREEHAHAEIDKEGFELVDREHVYVSPHPELWITIEPKDDVPIVQGTTVRNRRTPGHRIEFKEGEFRTRRKVEIDFLAQHERRDITYREVTRDIGTPPSGPAMQVIIGLTGQRDVAELHALLADEQESWGREDVLLAIEKALEILGETAPPREPQEPTHQGPMGGMQAATAGAAPVATETVKDERTGETHPLVPRDRAWAPQE
jgi:hypothetical protein